MQIARWTTPTIIYKPQAVEVETVAEIYLTIKQSGAVVIKRDMSTAAIDADTGFSWTLTQEESQALQVKKSAIVQVDYKCYDEMRYTTVPKIFEIGDSAVNEEI